MAEVRAPHTDTSFLKDFMNDINGLLKTNLAEGVSSATAEGFNEGIINGAKKAKKQKIDLAKLIEIENTKKNQIEKEIEDLLRVKENKTATTKIQIPDNLSPIVDKKTRELGGTILRNIGTVISKLQVPHRQALKNAQDQLDKQIEKDPETWKEGSIFEANNRFVNIILGLRKADDIHLTKEDQIDEKAIEQNWNKISEVVTLLGEFSVYTKQFDGIKLPKYTPHEGISDIFEEIRDFEEIFMSFPKDHKIRKQYEAAYEQGRNYGKYDIAHLLYGKNAEADVPKKIEEKTKELLEIRKNLLELELKNIEEGFSSKTTVEELDKLETKLNELLDIYGSKNSLNQFDEIDNQVNRIFDNLDKINDIRNGLYDSSPIVIDDSIQERTEDLKAEEKQAKETKKAEDELGNALLQLVKNSEKAYKKGEFKESQTYLNPNTKYISDIIEGTINGIDEEVSDALKERIADLAIQILAGLHVHSSSIATPSYDDFFVFADEAMEGIFEQFILGFREITKIDLKGLSSDEIEKIGREMANEQTRLFADFFEVRNLEDALDSGRDIQELVSKPIDDLISKLRDIFPALSDTNIEEIKNRIQKTLVTGISKSDFSDLNLYDIGELVITSLKDELLKNTMFKDKKSLSKVDRLNEDVINTITDSIHRILVGNESRLGGKEVQDKIQLMQREALQTVLSGIGRTTSYSTQKFNPKNANASDVISGFILNSSVKEQKEELDKLGERAATSGEKASKAMKKIADAADNARESVEKLNDAVSSVGDSNENNLSSDATTLPSQIEKITQAEERMGNATQEATDQTRQGLAEMREEAEKTTQSIADMLSVWDGIDTSTNERFMLANSKSGYHTDSTAQGDYDFISQELVNSAIKNAEETVDTMIHTHPDKLAVFSHDDIFAAIEEMRQGIVHQFIKANSEVSYMDFSKLGSKTWKLIAKDFERRYYKLVETDGFYEDDDVTQEMLDDFQSKMKQALINSIAFITGRGKDFANSIYKTFSMDEIKAMQSVSHTSSSDVSNKTPDLYKGQSEQLSFVENLTEAEEKASEGAVELATKLSKVDDQISSQKTLDDLEKEQQQIAEVRQEQEKLNESKKEEPTTPLLSDSKFSLQNISDETEQLNHLHELLHTIIELVNKKTKAFEEEANMVGAVSSREETSLQKVIDALKTIREQVDKISELFSDLKIGSELNTSWVKDLLKLEGKDFSSVATSLSQLTDAINKLKVKDNSFVNTLTGILTKGKELENLSKILSQSSQKIKDAEEATKSKAEKGHSSNVHKSYEKELQLTKELLDLRHKIAMEDAKGNADKSEEFKVRNLTKMRQLEKDIAEIKKRSKKDTDKDERNRINSEIRELEKKYQIEEEGERKATELREQRKAESEAEKARLKEQAETEKVRIKAEADAEKERTRALEKLNNELDSYNNKLKTNITRDAQQRLSGGGVNKDLLNEWTSLQSRLTDIQNKLKSGEIDTSQARAEFDKLKESIDEALSPQSKKFEKIVPEEVITKLGTKIEDFASRNTNLGRELSKRFEEVRVRYEALLNSSATGDALERELKAIDSELNKIKADADKAGEAGKSFGHKIIDSLTNANARFIANYLSIQDMIRYIRTIATTITEVDSALTELRKVSNATNIRLQQNFEKSADTAKELGSTITDVINQTADWARLGYNVDDAEKLARVTTLFQTVGDNMTAETASEAMISTLKAYGIAVDQSERIVDQYNEVANNFAIDTAGLADSITRAGAALHAGGNALSESMGLIVAANDSLQDPSSVGQMLKTMSMRLRGASAADLEKLGIDTEGMTQGTKSIVQQFKAMAGIDIMEGTDYKSTFQILDELHEKWADLTDAEHAALTEAVGGKRGGSVMSSLMENWADAKAVVEQAENSTGSAMREQQNYAQSIQYSIDRTKASLQELQADLISSGSVKAVVEMANSLVNAIDKIVTNKTALVAIFSTITSAFAVKNNVGGLKNTSPTILSYSIV